MSETKETDADTLARLGTDAKKWADEFTKIHGIEHSLTAWFANAISVGYDAGIRDERKRANVQADDI